MALIIRGRSSIINHFEGGCVKQMYYNWLQFIEGVGVVNFYIVKIILDCWLVSYGV